MQKTLMSPFPHRALGSTQDCFESPRASPPSDRIVAGSFESSESRDGEAARPACEG